MKYKTIKIYSHPRSGSNYFAQVINKNFTKFPDYNEIYGEHNLPNDLVTKNKDVAIFYIKRNFTDVSKSIFKMKERFGLNVNSYNQLLNSTYKSVYSNKIKSYIKVKTSEGTKIETKISLFFSNIAMKPKDYHNFHISEWSKQKKHINYFEVDYEALISDFDTIMKNISLFLGVEKKEFEDINERVGYIPPEKGLHRVKMNAYNLLLLRPFLMLKKTAKKIIKRK